MLGSPHTAEPFFRFSLSLARSLLAAQRTTELKQPGKAELESSEQKTVSGQVCTRRGRRRSRKGEECAVLCEIATSERKKPSSSRKESTKKAFQQSCRAAFQVCIRKRSGRRHMASQCLVWYEELKVAEVRPINYLDRAIELCKRRRKSVTRRYNSSSEEAKKFIPAAMCAERS